MEAKGMPMPQRNQHPLNFLTDIFEREELLFATLGRQENPQ